MRRSRIIKVCGGCKKEFETLDDKRVFCSRGCCGLAKKGKPFSEEHKAAMRKPKSPEGRASMSEAALKRGKWKGEDNPNYGSRLRKDPEKYVLWRESVKERGQPWTEKECSEHSKKMMGSTNKMRGKNHTEESKKKMSETQKKRYEEGSVNFGGCHSSKAELEIKDKLIAWKFNPIHQYQIKGFPYFYDFYIASLNLILEFNGDYWHANPIKYKAGTYINIQRSGPVPVEEIWERDFKKLSAAKENGYNTAVIWEYDYCISGDIILRDILWNI